MQSHIIRENTAKYREELNAKLMMDKKRDRGRSATTNHKKSNIMN